MRRIEGRPHPLYPRFALAAGAAAALLVAGCAVAPPPGSVRGVVVRPDDDGPRNPMLVMATSLAPTGEPAPPARTVVQMRGAFLPDFAAVAAGGSIRFVNEDPIYHQLFSTDGAHQVDLGPLQSGQARDHQLLRTGPARFYCSLHENESGIVYVTATPHFATVDPSGRFELAGLRPGRYALQTWSEDTPVASALVTIQEGTSTTLDLVLGDAEGSP